MERVYNFSTKRYLNLNGTQYNKYLAKNYYVKDGILYPPNDQTIKEERKENTNAIDQSLPIDVLNNIINSADMSDLLNLCYNNKNINTLCKQNYNFKLYIKNLGNVFFTEYVCMILTKQGLYATGSNFYYKYVDKSIPNFSLILPIKNVLTVCGWFNYFVYYTNEGLFLNNDKLNFSQPVKKLECNETFVFIVTYTNKLYYFRPDNYHEPGIPTIIETSFNNVIDISVSDFYIIIQSNNTIFKYELNKFKQYLNFLPDDMKTFDIPGKILKMTSGFDYALILADYLYSITLSGPNPNEIRVVNTQKVLDIAQGKKMSLYLTDESLYVFGSDNTYGELAQGNTTINYKHIYPSTAISIPFGKTIKNIYAGHYSGVIRTIDDKYYGLGINIFNINNNKTQIKSITKPKLFY